MEPIEPEKAESPGVQPDLRRLPGIEKLLHAPELVGWGERLVHRVRVKLAQEVVAELREDCLRGKPCPAFREVVAKVDGRFARFLTQRIRKVINATGVILHTNLGRAPLGRDTLEKMAEELDGYCSLELEMVYGERGSRGTDLEKMLTLLCEAPAAVAVNNNAASLFFVLNTFASGMEVVISRGELVQIGGGFRIPEILAAANARLVEVGTTNITRLEDYEAALRPETALILKVHQSCFQMSGHVESPRLDSLAALAKRAGKPLVFDIGSGLLSDEAIEEPTVADSLRSGAALVCFSGDKLFGGPQAGLVVGEKEMIGRLRRAPLYRALRLGKTELYLLEQTLLRHASGRPTLTSAYLRLPLDEVRARSQRLCERLAAFLPGARLQDGTSAVGGGTLPAVSLPTVLVEVFPPVPERFVRACLQGDPAVVVRRENKRIFLDLRTVAPEEEKALVGTLKEAVACSS